MPGFATLPIAEVLRKASGGPSFATQPKDGSNGPTPDPDPGVEYAATTQPTVEVAAASPEVNDLDHAFQVAKVKHGLQDRTELTAALAEGHVRSVVKVRSMVTTFPDYLLATVVGRGGLKGVAMFTLADPSHPEFAGMTYSDEALPRYPLVSASDARRLLRTSGVVASGEPTLVWGWSAETNSPYYPMWQVNTKSGTRFITSTGNVIADPEFQAPLAR